MTQVVIRRPTWAEIFTVSVELTDAQIKALPTTPLTIVAAPGVGKRIAFLFGYLSVDASAGAYTDIAADASVMFGAPGTGVSVFMLNSVSLSLTSVTDFFAAGSQRADFGPLLSVDAAEGYGGLAIPRAVSEVENLSLILTLSNGEIDLTGGNAANTLKVTVIYTIIDV